VPLFFFNSNKGRIFATKKAFMCEFIAASELQHQINIAASHRSPFVFAIDYNQAEGLFINHPLTESTIQWRVPQATNYKDKVEKDLNAPHPVLFKPHPEAKEIYAKRFEIVMNQLKKGNSFLTNLTVKTPLDMNLTLQQIFAFSDSPYALYIPNKFVCFSPEIFVRIDQHGRISSYPMKGTIDATLPHASQTILQDKKESAEHYTIVDLIRNDLSCIATQVHVDRLRYIDTLHTSRNQLLQVSSEISGQLPEDYLNRLGDILFRLLPAGSITGAPKCSTQQIIDQAEQQSRGYYTGIFGYFDGQTLDTAVMIRFIEQEKNGSYFFRSGGGITAKSNMNLEYEEVIQKIYLPFN